MNFVRSGLLLLLLGTGITLILLSRCVEKPAPPAPAPEKAASRPASRPAPLRGRAAGPASRPQGRDQKKPLSPLPARKPLSPPEEEFARGRVVDNRGLPVEGARVETLDKPPASALGKSVLPLFMEVQAALLKKKAGIEDFDQMDMAERSSRLLYRPFLPSGPLEPHALSGKDGTFRIGPLPQKTCWLRARKGNLATFRAVRARPGKEILLVLLPAASLRVEVLGPEGKPLPGCKVRLADQSAFQQANLGGMGVSALSYREGKTGKNGAFTFLGLKPGGPYLALALPRGLAPVFSQPVLLPRGARKKLTLTALPGGSLVLRVRDSRNAPLRGVHLRLFPLEVPLSLINAMEPPRALTGPGGQASFQGLLPGTWAVQAFTRGMEPESASFRIARGKTARLEITLEPGAELSGVVQDEKGTPLANALVGYGTNIQGLNLASLLDPLSLLDPRTAVRTGPQGKFTLRGLPARPLSLVAWAPGCASRIKRGIRPGKKKRVLIRLSRNGAVEGRVLGPSGKPVHRFSVRAWREAMMGMRRSLAKGDFASKDGKFHLAGIPPGPFLVEIRAPGLAPREIPDLEIEGGETARIALPIQLGLPALVEGKVLDPKGFPVPGARVRLLPMGKNLVRIPGFSPPPPAARTGPKGGFRLRDLPAGRWKIEADGGPRGLAEGKKPVETREGAAVRDLLLVLLPPASLEGEVYDSSGSPSKGTAVLLQRIQEGGFKQRWTRTDKEGKFFASGLAPGRWQVISLGAGLMKNAFLMQDKMRKEGKIDLKGFLDQSRIAMVRLQPGRTARVVLGRPAGPSGVLEGTVTSGGRPLPGAMVTLVRTGTRKGEKAESPRITATGKDGRFRFDHLRPGKYIAVILSKTLGGTQLQKTVVVRAGETSSLRAAFGEGVVKGRLMPRGKCGALGGRIVVLFKEGSPSPVGSSVTDGRGRFKVDRLAPGAYRFYVRPLFKAGPGEPVGRSEPFQVREGMSSLEVQVPVEPAAAIQGSLDRPPAKGAKVIARVEGWPQPFQAKLDPAGLFRIGGLPPGKTRLEAFCGKLRGSLELLTSPGETTRVVIHLQPK